MIEVKKEYYIYVYLDPRKPGKYTYEGMNGYCFYFEPFYVGKGKGGRKYRHIKYARKNVDNITKFKNNHMLNKCAQMLREGIEPIIKTYKSNLFEETAWEIEKNLIKVIGRKKEGGPLSNYHQGGKIGPHDWHSEEMRKKISSKHPANQPNYTKEKSPRWGCKHSKETKRLLSELKLGTTLSDITKKRISESCKKSVPSGDDHYSRKNGFSEDHKRKMSESQKGRKHTKETLKKIGENNSMKNPEVVNKVMKSKCFKIFDIMIKCNHTFKNNKFNKITYELARSKLYARAYPNWDKMISLFEFNEIKSYFSQ